MKTRGSVPRVFLFSPYRCGFATHRFDAAPPRRLMRLVVRASTDSQNFVMKTL
jgi:hypothetical protein